MKMKVLFAENLIKIFFSSSISILLSLIIFHYRVDESYRFLPWKINLYCTGRSCSIVEIIYFTSLIVSWHLTSNKISLQDSVST